MDEGSKNVSIPCLKSSHTCPHAPNKWCCVIGKCWKCEKVKTKKRNIFRSFKIFLWYWWRKTLNVSTVFEGVPRSFDESCQMPPSDTKNVKTCENVTCKAKMRNISRKVLNLIFRSFIIYLWYWWRKTLNVLTFFRRGFRGASTKVVKCRPNIRKC